MENEVLMDNSIDELAIYDDYYYNQVLNKMDNIISQDNTIITNQQALIGLGQVHNTSFNVICFLLVLLIIYIFIRDILHL